MTHPPTPMPLTEQRMLSLDLYRRPDGQLDVNTVTACLNGNRDYYVALTILCMRFTLSLFPHVPDPGSDLPQYPNELAETIRFALWRGKVTPMVVIKALYFLKKLKGFYPHASVAARASPLQILAAALVAAHKEHIEPFDTYSNKDWAEKIWQKLFELRVFNQMERELVNHLKHDLRIDNQTFVRFVYELYAEVPWELPPPPCSSALAPGNRAPGSGPSAIGRDVTSGTLSAQRQRDIHAYGLDPTTAPKAIAQPGTASASLATVDSRTRSRALSTSRRYTTAVPATPASTSYSSARRPPDVVTEDRRTRGRPPVLNRDRRTRAMSLDRVPATVATQYAAVPTQYVVPPAFHTPHHLAYPPRRATTGMHTHMSGVSNGPLNQVPPSHASAMGGGSSRMTVVPGVAPPPHVQPIALGSGKNPQTYGYQSGLAAMSHGGYAGSSGHALPRDVDSEDRGRSRKREKAKGSKRSESLGIFSRLFG